MKKGKKRKNRSQNPPGGHQRPGPLHQKGAEPPSHFRTSSPFFAEKLQAFLGSGLMVILCVELLWGGWEVTQRLMHTAPPSLQIDPELLNTHDSLRKRVVPLQRKLISAVLAHQSPAAWLDLGSLYLVAGRYPQAELCFRVAKSIDPNSGDIAFALGASLDMLGRTSEAIDEYRHASRFAQGQHREACFYLIGKNYLRQEDPENAVKAFRETSTHLPASYELVKILLRTGKVHRIASEMHLLEYNRPHAMEIYMLRSWIADALGEPAAAAQQRVLADAAPRQLAYAPLQDFCIDFRKRFP